MLKKVASMGFVAFFGFSLAANICSASNKDVNVPGKWTNFVPTSIKDGNAPAKWMGFVPTKVSDEYSTYDGSTTDCNDDGEYSNYDGSTTDYYDDGEYSVYGDSTTDYNYDGSTTDSSYYDNDDDSTTDSYYDSSNATESRARQIEKQRTGEKILVSQRTRPQMWRSLHNKRDTDEDYVVNEEALQAEQDREDKDLEDMGIKAVWERRKK